ncbi:LysM peptidoglycan-binding domain-containing protein [Micromonospora sp. NIE79]|uniref:LysM peptidoglycan-binding domain-containing protein n=1 Tax=Micromonospora trifolii TaxID=2911208 RepID=A0ABS9N8P8_9ACTN|nr:LysM peptidoglycan-binding domain-containing protein [Micromonospora trifolii]MCG5446213.1 LysM peptidoglycan-binding domain-containing protein [Micromonospora trifolii]
MTRTRTLALATSVLTTATAPVVLSATDTWQPPSPTSDDIRQLIASPLSPHLVTALIGAAAATLWLVLITTLLTHAYAMLARRARWTVTIRLPGPIRSLTAALLGASAVTTATGTIAHATPVTSTTDQPATEPVTAAPRPLATHSTAEHPPPAHRTAPTHTVQRGDTLSEIAEEALGDDKRWREIFALNRGTHFATVGGTLRNPNLIFPGWVLTLPAADMPPDSAPPRNPPTQDPPRGPTASPPTTATAAPRTTAHASSPTAAPNTSPTARPQPSATSPAADDGVVEPPSASVSPTPGITNPATSTTAPGPPTADRSNATTPPAGTTDDRPSHSLWGWVEIGGGAIGAGLAAALVSAATMVWKRRRHRYRPTPITSPVLADADLTPPLAALTRLRHGVRRIAPHLLTRTPARGRTVREDTTAQVTPPPSSAAPNDTESARVGAGLGLDGPAALDAARALLVATLTPGADGPHAHGRVIIPAATLTTLLGVSAVDLHPMPGLTVAPTFAAALTLLEEEIIRRSRILADQEAVTVFALQQEHTVGEPLPHLLLIADVPEHSWHTRLATAIHLGTNVDIGAALIGTWPHGITLTVAADGTTGGGHGERVGVLGATAATDILRMLAEAHGGTAPATTTPGPPAPGAPATVRHGDTTRAAPEKVNPTPQSSLPAQGAAPPDQGATAAAGRVRARVLGHPTILDGDGIPVRGLRAKSMELFVYLVVHRGGANLDDIMEAIWPDVTVSRASERLSTCAANLRTTIRSIAQTGTGPNDATPKIEPVINTGGRYHLDPTLLDVDWWTVQDSYARVATAVDDADRLAHLHAAIAAACGGLADGSTYEWIDTDREHARRHLVKVYAQAAGLHLGTDPAAALALYDTARALDPLSDELTRRAMRTAARLGDAVGVRERLVALRGDLGDAGIDIDADTEDLATSLLHELTHQ